MYYLYPAKLVQNVILPNKVQRWAFYLTNMQFMGINFGFGEIIFFWMERG
jgi:hypothetical protein